MREEHIILLTLIVLIILSNFAQQPLEKPTKKFLKKQDLNISDSEIRKPFRAGTWYPSSPQELDLLLQKVFESDLGPGKPGESLNKREIKISVVPHAAIFYSGYAAAQTFKALKEDGKPDTIVFIGAKHTNIGKDIAVSNMKAWETPFGLIKVDRELSEEIVNNCDICEFDDLAHSQEHSIEIELPFLQYIYDISPKIVPIVISRTSRTQAKSIAQSIYELIKDKDVVVILSNDLTHYEDQETAIGNDMYAIDAFLRLNPDAMAFASSRNAIDCGSCGLIGIELAHLLGVNDVSLLQHHTSGDVSRDYTSVVGYASIVFRITEHNGQEIVNYARNIIKGTDILPPTSSMIPGGAFVTLEKNGQLRGCMGTYGEGSVFSVSIATSAYNAANRDPRFPPLSEGELEESTVTVNHLSNPKELSYSSEKDLLSKIKVGRDGLIMRYKTTGGLLLPEVPVEHHYGPEAYLQSLSMKSGLSPAAWKQSGVRIFTFRTTIFKELEPNGDVIRINLIE